MTTNKATSTAKSQRHSHNITIVKSKSPNEWRDEIVESLHALEIRVVKLEQWLKFGGCTFMILQLAVTFYLGMKSG